MARGPRGRRQTKRSTYFRSYQSPLTLNHNQLLKKAQEKLGLLEFHAPDKNQFWLDHLYILRGDDQTLRSFLNITEPRDLLSENQCENEFCRAQTVVCDYANDDYVCHTCGFVQNGSRAVYLIYKSPSSIYKHQVHLHQILHELQCLRHRLPDGILDEIRYYLKLHNQLPTYINIRKSLRKCGFNQHYKMIPSLQYHLDPTFTPLILSKEHEIQIQGKFFDYISLGHLEDRKCNRLNYHYVIFKICELLGYDHVNGYLNCPKGKVSLENHYTCWRKICKALNWQFINKEI